METTNEKEPDILHIENALVVMPAVCACLLLKELQDACEGGYETPDWDEGLHPDLAKAIESGKAPYGILSDPSLNVHVAKAQLGSVAILLDRDTVCFNGQNAAWTWHFTGSALDLDGEPLGIWSDEPLMAFVPADGEKGTPEAYAVRLEEMLGPGFPYAKFIGTVDGTFAD